MFHTIINLAYIIPNIYVFLRIWFLFINRGYKLLYTVIYLLICSIYPLSNLFSENDSGILAQIFTSTANYILPFYLYIFLAVLVVDILLLLNCLFKIIPVQKLTDNRFKTTGLSVILLISILVVVGGVINFNTIRTSEYSIGIPRKLSVLKHLKIAFVADFHLQQRINQGFVQRFTEKIKAINPDLMIYGGDIVEGDRADGNMVRIENMLKGVKTRFGVFGVLGNHEHYGGDDKGRFFSKSGIGVLCDTVMVIDSAFNLGGRFDSHFENRKPVDTLMKYSKSWLPLILVDHRPTAITEVSRTATDVQLSGHTHDGQMFPINLITNKVYELSWGYRKIGNTHFFVTSGIRLWGPPVRTAGKSEIMVINIDFTDN